MLSIKEQNLPDYLGNDVQNELFRKLHSGNKTVREVLINHNMRLVTEVIWKDFKEYHFIDFDDLFQVGLCALIDSVDHFDLSRGFQFSIYARKNIYTRVANKILKNEIIYHNSELVFSSFDNPSIFENYGYIENFDVNLTDKGMLNLFNDLDSEVKNILNLRLGNDYEEPKTLNGIYDMVSYSRFQIFLMMKYGICKIASHYKNFDASCEEVDIKDIKKIFSEYRHELRNKNGFCYCRFNVT